MSTFYLLRHGPTQYNREHRLQGRADIPLLPQACSWLNAHQVPTSLTNITWFTSPLLRASQTAACLGLAAQPVDVLIEMDFGCWQGQRLSDLRQADPEQMTAIEQRGLQMTPPGGESPAKVLERVLPWLEQLPLDGDYGCVCHKGVMRALLAHAIDWDMCSSLPLAVDWHCLIKMQLTDAGLYLKQINIPLVPRQS